MLHDPAVEEDEDGESFAAQMLSVARNPSDERVLTRAKLICACIVSDNQCATAALKVDAYHRRGLTPRTSRIE